jgi:predicted Zn-dependent peptidase
MTIALVGDFDPKEARRLIGDYFGDIPPGPPPPEVATVEPGPLGMRRGVVRKGTERSVRICFPGFHQLSRDAITAEFLSAVLSRDVTSRLDHRLDVEEKAVRRVYASHNGGYIRYPGVFEITAESVEGFTNEALEKMIWEELERVVADPVSEERVDEIRRSFRKSYYYEIETNGGLADELVEQQMVYGDWRHGFRRFEEHKTVTADEVTKLAARLFKRDKATVVYLEPENEAMEDGKGGDS